VRGERSVVVLSAAEYDKLIQQRPSLTSHLIDPPLWDTELAEIVSHRSRNPSRASEF
jgi:hypothetical protein